MKNIGFYVALCIPEENTVPEKELHMPTLMKKDSSIPKHLSVPTILRRLYVESYIKADP